MLDNTDEAGNNFIADSEQRIKFRKRLYELSLKSLRDIPELEEPNEEQAKWLDRKMRGMR
jgi:hypothetical protein